ncbi:MAG TPA: hypothetical protein VFE62_11060 [Gemmataceae bacterium]|nr:hypothetical protein [Gemmataceae bacterium]
MRKITARLLVVVALTLATIPMAHAGRIPGPGQDTKICQAFGTVTYYEVFRGGEQARIAIAGDGSSDLDVLVYDMQGRLVAQGIGPTDIELVTFFPVQAQTYRIVVRNLGGNANRFSMASN